MNKYKGVIFDFNGTLFFDNDQHIKAWGEISKIIRGYGMKDEELQHHFNDVPNKRIIQYLSQNQCDEETIHKYSSLKELYYRMYCQRDIFNFHLVDGIQEYFDDLNEQNIPFTIVSISIKDNIDFFVESFHLDRWINREDIIYDNGSYENKNDMFKKAADVIDVPLSDCLIFEDSLSGIQNAYKAGCHRIIVINSADKTDEYKRLPGVIKVIDNFKEI